MARFARITLVESFSPVSRSAAGWRPPRMQSKKALERDRDGVVRLLGDGDAFAPEFRSAAVTMQVANDLRYGFDREAGIGFIHGRINSSAHWSNRPANPATDHVIVSRIFDSRTGEVVIA